jgi:hypothetical protein
MKKMPLLSLLLVGFLFIPGFSNLSAEDSSAALGYGHISYVDKGATVIRQDKTEQKAIVNLPVVPGDQIVTGDEGRCEIQFGNGTILRLDKNSRLKVTTILAPTLTTNWKVTTLHLMRGQLYSMTQNYNKEMFQVITPNAAIDLKKRAATTIRLEEDGDTFIFADKGKFKVMFGENVKNLSTEKITPKKGYLISANHKLSLVKDERDIDFVGWNEYVNRNFKDLHYGVSKVPKKIYRHNKGLVYWAEKWSNLYGDWIYDDVFGYVWKPGDEIFSYSKRPFFHAQYVRVNKELFLVPTQPWGWAPAHMGTWVWMKWGWTWVPGDAFHSGISGFRTFAGMRGSMYYGTLDYWLYPMFGNRDLFWIYKYHGYNAWRSAYMNIYGRTPPKPRLKDAPDSVRFVLKSMLKAPAALLKEKLGSNRPSPVIDRNQLAPLLKTDRGVGTIEVNKSGIAIIKPPDVPKSKSAVTKPAVSKPAVTKPAVTVKKGATLSKFGNRTGRFGQIQPRISKRGGGGMLRKGKLSAPAIKGFRDFNPDVRWGVRKGMNVSYNSTINAMVCPKLAVNSRTISNHMRNSLRSRGGVFKGRKGSGGGSVSSSSGSTASSNTSAGTATKSGGSAGGGRSGGMAGATEKK